MRHLLKLKIVIVFLLFLHIQGFAQNTGISDIVSTPAASAVLDVYSTTRGMLVPRMTQAQRVAIASPATGLLVYQTDGTAGFYYYNSVIWTTFSGSTGWLPGGNSVISLQSLGTTSNFDLPFITNNIEKMRITNNGNVIIGNGDGTIAPAGGTLRAPNAGGAGNVNGAPLTFLGGNATGTANGGNVNITGGGTIGGTGGVVNINVNANNATRINTGTSARNVTIGGPSNNILFPKFLAVGSVFYTTANTGQIGSASNLHWDNTNTRLGVGNLTPNSTLSVSGSLTMSYKIVAGGSYTILATDFAVINTGVAGTWTLPSAATCPGRIYRLINHGTGSLTISPSITKANGITFTSLVAGASANTIEIISDATVWRKIK